MGESETQTHRHTDTDVIEKYGARERTKLRKCYTQTNRQTDRQTDRDRRSKTDRDRESDTQTESDRQIDRQTNKDMFAVWESDIEYNLSIPLLKCPRELDALKSWDRLVYKNAPL